MLRLRQITQITHIVFKHSKGLSNQADVELGHDKCNICSRYCIYHVKFTSYCELIECSRPIRFFIVSLMYNNICCLDAMNGQINGCPGIQPPLRITPCHLSSFFGVGANLRDFLLNFEFSKIQGGCEPTSLIIIFFYIRILCETL